MKTIAKISEESLKIVNYLEGIAHGETLSYDQIEKATGVKMDTKGRSYLRTAIKKLKREYSCIVGKGIELASAKSATNILVGRVVKIDNAVKRAEKTQTILVNNFYDQLQPIEQKQALFLGAVFGAIRVAAQNGKHYIQNATSNQMVAPMLPENIK